MKILSTNLFISERIKVKPITNAELDKAAEAIFKHKYFPKAKHELRKLINDRISREGTACDLNNIDVSGITDMSYLFAAKDEHERIIHDRVAEFSGDISKWNVSNVTNMEGMFYFAEQFNSDISKWNVSNVTNMEGMFCKAARFNQNISEWDVRNVTKMSYMFQYASSFRQDLSGWNVRKVTQSHVCFLNSGLYNSRDKWPKFSK